MWGMWIDFSLVLWLIAMIFASVTYTFRINRKENAE